MTEPLLDEKANAPTPKSNISPVLLFFLFTALFLVVGFFCVCLFVGLFLNPTGIS